jgi:hypothetical protein
MQSPDPSHLLQFLLIVALFVSIGANVALMFRGRRRDVAFIPNPISKDEFRDTMEKHEVNGHSEQFAKVRTEMNTTMTANNLIGEQRAEKIHNRINEILKGLARVEGILDELIRKGGS